MTDDVIPAGGRKIVRIKIRPCVRGQHNIELQYKLKMPIISKNILYYWLKYFLVIIDQSEVGAEPSLCSIVFNAVYPSMSITSVLGEGSLSYLSKPKLWSLLSIDKLVCSHSDVVMMMFCQTEQVTTRRPIT